MFVLRWVAPMFCMRMSFTACTRNDVESPRLQAIKQAVAQLLHNFDDIQPTLLLFLQKLQCIAITDHTSQGKDAVMLRRQLPNGVVELRYGSEAQHSQKWLVVTQTVQPGVIVQCIKCVTVLYLQQTKLSRLQSGCVHGQQSYHDPA